MSVEMRLPKYVRPKTLSTGETAFYWEPPAVYRKKANAEGKPFPFESVVLGTGIGMRDLDQAARPFNDQFDQWRLEAKRPDASPKALGQYGTVKWLVETYLRSDQFMEKVGERSRPDYRNLFIKICALPTKSGRSVGALPVKSISARAADRIYNRMREDGKLRRGEKVVEYCRKAWTVMGRLYPDLMARDPEDRTILNPWVGVATAKRTRTIKTAVDRATVYAFAEAAIGQGRPEVAAAAVIAFEWMHRPENIVCGYFAGPITGRRASPNG